MLTSLNRKAIPLVDLEAQNGDLREPLEAAALRVLRSGRYCLGPEVEAFEQEFADYCEAKHAVAVNSGTSALQLALLACEVGPGDEVITVALTFVATIAAILYTGARPILVDVEPSTWTIDTKAVEAAVTPRTKAIVAVHLHGRPADLAPLQAIARAHGLRLIEDASQSHGALYKGRRVGAIGHVGSFSFYPSKPLGALGEGGAIVTNDRDIAERIRLLRNWGQVRPNEHVLPGHNMRMDAVQAAMLRVKLPYVDGWSAARAGHAERYASSLGDCVRQRPKPLPGCTEVHHVFAVEVEDRERVRTTLANAGIETGVHYPVPVHRQPAYFNLGYGEGDFPVAEHIAARTLSLPIFAEMSTQQIDEVCRIMRSCEARFGSERAAQERDRSDVPIPCE
jgi:dTDP-4-amino-4,6-dideoxygalactose transaminase